MKNMLLQSGEYPLISSPQLSKELGHAGAMFLQKLHFLINENRKFKQKKNLTTHNNRKWWFHTFEEGCLGKKVFFRIAFNILQSVIFR